MFKRRDAKGGEKPERYRSSDVLAMIVASLQILLPIVAAIIGTAAVGFLVFLLLFR